jgi:hypothetical protein
MTETVSAPAMSFQVGVLREWQFEVWFTVQGCQIVTLCGYILEGMEMENVGIFYCHMEQFSGIWHILPFWYVAPRKIWQPC